MSRFFIDRPVFAIVISLFLLLVGTLSLIGLPIGEFPNIALPTVQVNGFYLGASSDVVEESVAAPIDQQINGATDMLYISSVSGDDGSASIAVTFELERDADLAAVEVQNRVAQANSQLPSEVINAGVTVRKQSPDTLLYFAIFSPDGTYDPLFISNYGYVYIVDELKRVKGVGDVKVFGSDFGMRIWLRPDRMASLGITASDVAGAIREQNVQVPAGQVGQPPATRGQSFQYSLRVKGRLVKAEEFADIIVGSKPDGSFIRIRDIGRVELGARSYSNVSTIDGKAAALVSVSLVPGANALETAGLLKAQITRLAGEFPQGLDYKIVYDTSEFVEASVEEVIHTFVEALILVLIVVFLFLQNWRTTLIPMLAVPVSLVATFAAFQVLGFTINTLSLFGMVLAIGIVVDDAIVVVEAVEHKMRSGLAVREATIKAMDEVQGPVMAIALILAAVFVPMGFIPGVTGQLYKQFAVTVAVSTMFSAVVAITLTPTLCILLMKPHAESDGGVARFFKAFNSGFDRAQRALWQGRGSARPAHAARRAHARRRDLRDLRTVPGGADRLRAGRGQGRRLHAGVAARCRFAGAHGRHPGAGGTTCARNPGSRLGGRRVRFRPALGHGRIERRAGHRETEAVGRAHHGRDRLRSILMQLYGLGQGIPEAVLMPFNPPALPGFGSVSGFSLMLQAKSNQPPQELAQVAQDFIAAAQQRPEIGRISTTFSASTPNYQLFVDREKAKKLGVPVSDVFTTLQTFLGGFQVNDFSRFGRNYKVTMQAESDFRQEVTDIARLFVRNRDGGMVPLDTLTTWQQGSGARFMQRYNLYRTAAFSGTPAPGASSGDAIRAIEEVAAATLPDGYGIEWSGQSKQEIEAGNSSTIVLGLSIVVVFLFLAALYESWAVPFAVLLATPFGLMGALFALKLVGIPFNVYGQIGLVTLVGLSAKNAILIVEFAKINREQGMPIFEAALDAARLRLRPILMTSFAFILGVVPLVLASGAGAASKVSVGITVFGGMIFATVLTTLAVPAFYVLIQGLSERFGGDKPPTAPAVATEAGAASA